MSKRIVYGIQVDTSEADQSIKRLQERLGELGETAEADQQEINALTQEIKDLGESANNIDTKKGQKSANDLKKAYTELIKELRNTEQGSERFRELSEQAGALKNQINDVANSVKNLSGAPVDNVSNSFRALQSNILSLNVAGVARSFGDLKTSLLAVASSTIGIQTGMSGAAVATRLFGAALVATGIGAFAVAIGTLIANFDTIKESGGVLGKVLTAIGNVVSTVTENVLKLSDALGLTENAFDNWNKKRIEAAKKAAGEENKIEEDLIEKARKRREQLDQNREDFKERSLAAEIEYWKTIEKEQYEAFKLSQMRWEEEEERFTLLQKKRDEILAAGKKASKEELKTVNDLMEASLERSRILAKELDTASKLVEESSNIGWDLKKLQLDEFYKLRLQDIQNNEKLEKIALAERRLSSEENAKALYDIELRNANNRLSAHRIWADDFKSAEQGVIDESIKIRELKLQETIRLEAQQRKAEEDAFKSDEAFTLALIELENERQEIKKNNLALDLSNLEKKTQIDKLYKESELEKLDVDRQNAAEKLRIMEEYGLNTQLELDLQKAELFAAEKAYYDKIKQLDDDALSKKLSNLEKEKQARRQITDQLLSAASNAMSRIIAFDTQATNIKLMNGNLLFEEQERIRKKSFENNKALNIVNAIIGTSQAVVNALGTSGPPWVGIAMAAITGAMGVAEVATIAAQQYTPGSQPSASLTPPSANIGSLQAASMQPAINFVGAGAGANISTAGGGTPESIAFTGSISVSEINQVQNTISLLESSSTLGGG